MVKLSAVDPLARSTTGPVVPRGDEVHVPLMSNPYQKGTPPGMDYENGYEFCQTQGHMQLGAAAPAQIQKWRLNSLPWRQGFAAAAQTMGLKIIGDQLLQAQKIAKARPDASPKMKDWALDTYGVDLDTGEALTRSQMDTEPYSSRIKKMRERRGECLSCGEPIVKDDPQSSNLVCISCQEKATKVAGMTALPHQSRVADKLHHTDALILDHGLGSGKCLRGDTPVLTNYGLVQISKLFETHASVPDTELVIPVSDLHVLSFVRGAYKWQRVKNLFREKLADDTKTFELTTRLNSKIETTGSHKFLSVRDGKIQWIPTNQLQLTDAVSVASILPVHDQIKVSLRLSAILELLCWQITEGWEKRNGSLTRIYQDNYEILNRLKSLFDNLYPDNKAARIVKYPNRCPFVYIFGRDYATELKSLGYEWGNLSRERKLPDLFFNLPDTDLKRCLRILFDAEGSAGKANIEFSTASITLAHQIQYLLTRFSIKAHLTSSFKCATNTVKKTKRQYYKLFVSGDSSALFETNIGFETSHKAQALSLITAKKRNPNFAIPISAQISLLKKLGILGAYRDVGGLRGATFSVSINTCLKFIEHTKWLISPAGLERYNTNSLLFSGTAGKYTKRTFLALSTYADQLLDSCESLRDLLDSKLVFEPVHTVVPGKSGGFVYDLEIDSDIYDNKNFIAGTGALIVHNTYSAINAARQHKLPLLAIVPAALRNNFKKELAADQFPHEARVVSYQEAMNKKDDPEFRAFASKALVSFDEAHRMGQVTSSRSQLAADLPAKKKLLMTATPLRNSPEEIAPLVNAVSPGTFPNDPEHFNKNYLATREVPVGFWGRLKGVQPGHETVPVNLHHFAKAMKGKVDFYRSADRADFPSHDEKIIEVPMSEKQQASYDFVMGKYPTFNYRVRHGLPLGRRADQDFQAFMIGPRQVSNHPGGFNSSATDRDAPKVHAMVDEIQHRYKKDKNFRGVSYSSFLDAGINPLSRELTRRGIGHAIFNGERNDKERGEIIKNYNAGKTPVLLVSGAGAEGLDLKGTKLMQIMEPHWQEEQIGQVKGRAIRYKSHSHLPEDERHVEVQRFHSVPRISAWDRMLGRGRSSDKSVDEFIYDMAKKKSAVNTAFTNAMHGELPEKTSEFSGIIPVDNQLFPGLLVDLDETVVTQGGQFTPALGLQTVMPNRLEILKQFKDRGYKIIGVTNRALCPGDIWEPDDLMSLNQETLNLFPGLLDDIVCCLYVCEHQKPAPTMIYSAMTTHGLDPSNTIFTGDSDVDRQAAEAAGIPFYWAHDFFSTPDQFESLPAASPTQKTADWTDPRNMQIHVDKHGHEFGGPDSYMALEREIASAQPPDMRPVNRRCNTQISPDGTESTRCSTAYHSPATGLLHVKDDETGKTVSLYRKTKPYAMGNKNGP